MNTPTNNNNELTLLRNALLNEGNRRKFKVESSAEFTACVGYSKKDGDCCGYEKMPEFSYESIKWDTKKKPSRLSDNDECDQYSCLFRYYEDLYAYSFVDEDTMVLEDDQVRIENEIHKFKKIKILGYMYGTAENNSNESYFCAYQEVNGEKVLQAGQIQFFFTHDLDAYDENGKQQNLKHYFAFVRWYRFPVPGVHLLSAYTGNNMSCWQSEFEEISEACILPVQKIYSAINIHLDYFKDINLVLFKQRKFF